VGLAAISPGPPPGEVDRLEGCVGSGVATSALRFYETKGLIQSERTDGNQRRYLRATLRRVALIRAGQELGLSLAELADALETLPHDRTPTKTDWKRLSRAWRQRLEEFVNT
jgi:MerR family redox-sensitive transcriptional activator SoxR